MAVVAAAAAAGVTLEVFIAEEVLTNLVFQLVGQVVANALAPEFDALRGASYTLTPGTRLTPEQAAVAQVKGHMQPGPASDEARFYGLNGDRFATLVAAAGNPPPAELLLQWARRGIVPIADNKGAESVSAEQGIRESFLHNKWIAKLEEGQWQLPTLGAVIEARLRNFISPQEFNVWAHYLGFKSEIGGGGPGGGSEPAGAALASLHAPADLEFLAAGVPLSLTEAYTAYHRGLIPFDSPDPNVPSLKQIFRESRVIDKYVDVWAKLNEYRPPARVVSALLRAGSITDDQAKVYFKEDGLPDDLAAIYTRNGHKERSATTRELTKAELVALYVDQAIDGPELTKRLVARGWSEADAAAEIDLADLKVAHALEQRAVNRVGTLYMGRKIDKTAALASLESLKLPSAQRDRLLQIWTLERADNVRHLTPPIIGWLVKHGEMSEAEALAELGNLGFGAHDAWLVLTYETKEKLTTAEPSGNLPPS